MRRARRVVVGSCLVCLALVCLAIVRPGNAQTVEGDILRGEGAFLRGAAWYNFRTAQATSIYVDATIRWKQDLRKIQQERLNQEQEKKYAKIKNVQQVRAEIEKRKQELRTNPSPEDVQSGAALNALIYDLTDPDLKANQWSGNTISLPPGTSVKELIFSFTPHKVSTSASSALSKGVIALSRLDIKDKWPVLLKKDELAAERKAYEDAYNRIENKVLRGEYAVNEILAIDYALDSLKRKIATEIPLERGFRSEANKFVDDLRDATRMFDASSVDYAKEILTDTKDHDATTVQELVEFMSKYRLQFATADRSPSARVLYGQIYEKLREQVNAFINPAAAAVAPIPADDKPATKVALTVPAPPGGSRLHPLGNPGMLPVSADGTPLNLGFESGTLEGWKAEGQAFNGQPVEKNLRGSRAPIGRYHVAGNAGVGAQAKGTLTSEPFAVTHPYASYLLFTTRAKSRAEIVTADDNHAFHTASGDHRGFHPVVIDVKKIMGRRIFIRLVDDDPDGFVSFDDFRFHDTPPQFPPDPAPAAKVAKKK
jgi:hypothetical protein